MTNTNLQRYLKYKSKYLDLKNELNGGGLYKGLYGGSPIDDINTLLNNLGEQGFATLQGLDDSVYGNTVLGYNGIIFSANNALSLFPTEKSQLTEQRYNLLIEELQKFVTPSPAATFTAPPDATFVNSSPAAAGPAFTAPLAAASPAAGTSGAATDELQKCLQDKQECENDKTMIKNRLGDIIKSTTHSDINAVIDEIQNLLQQNDARIQSQSQNNTMLGNMVAALQNTLKQYQQQPGSNVFPSPAAGSNVFPSPAAGSNVFVLPADGSNPDDIIKYINQLLNDDKYEDAKQMYSQYKQAGVKFTEAQKNQYDPIFGL